MSKIPASIIQALESAWQEAVADIDEKDTVKYKEQLEKAKVLLRDRSVKIAQLEMALSASANESQRDLANSKQHVEGLSQALTNKQSTIEELKAVIDALGEENRALEERLENVTQTKDLEDALAEAQKDATTKIADYQAQLTALEADIARINEQNETLSSELEKEQESGNKANKALEDLTSQNESLRSELDVLTSSSSEQEEIKKEHAALLEEKATLMTELDSRGALLASLQIETRRLSEHLQRKQEENDALQRGNSMLQSRSNSVSEKYDSMADKLKQSEAKINDQSKHIEILERQLRLAEQKIDHLETQQTKTAS
ncbi:hypothetical protein DRW07_07450 [Alteromonas sediminis]|uniref:Uncharacterized protein n=1 Tax=Alteromonas sediminis TaxID=2259342 RepID=A0A3N5YD31_9ALTE|nr:hypothetical protein [Alteromonas sediminis]RPJ67355.1 hypothetical protein DRW07_07450 [Alteromonas sediminis]